METSGKMAMAVTLANLRLVVAVLSFAVNFTGCRRAAGRQGLSHRVSLHRLCLDDLHPSPRGVPARAARARVGRGPEPAHRVSIRGGPGRSPARSRGRARPAQGGPHRGVAHAVSPGSQECHAHDPDRRDESHRACRRRARAESRAPRRQRYRAHIRRRHGDLRQAAAAAQGSRPQCSPRGRPRQSGWQPTQPLIMESVKSAARSLGLPLQILEVREPGDFDAAFAAMVKERAGALLLSGDAMFFIHRARLADLALKSRLPSMSTQWQWVEAGGLMSYAPELP